VILASNRHGVQISTKTLIEGTLDAFEFQEHEGVIHIALIRITHNCKVEVQKMRVDLRSKAGVKTHQEKSMWFYAERNMKVKHNQASFTREVIVRVKRDRVCIGINFGEDRFQMYMIKENKVVNLVARVNQELLESTRYS
jgi:hypothetical protein